MTKPNHSIAAIQITSGPDVTANLLEAERLIGEAADAGAGLVVLPENFAFMGMSERDQLALREPDGDGQLQSFLAETAARRGVWLVGGTIPLVASDSNHVRAASLVVDDHGERIARYDKMHLFDVDIPGAEEHYMESSVIEPGEETLVVDSPFGRLGVAVCYDLRFPEMFRKMLDSGLELIAIPAAFTSNTGKAHWETLIRARAIENLAYVAAAGQSGHHANGRETHGHSMIVDPWGSVLAEIPSGVGFVFHPLDSDGQTKLRQKFPSIMHRRLKCR